MRGYSVQKDPMLSEVSGKEVLIYIYNCLLSLGHRTSSSAASNMHTLSANDPFSQHPAIKSESPTMNMMSTDQPLTQNVRCLLVS